MNLATKLEIAGSLRDSFSPNATQSIVTGMVTGGSDGAITIETDDGEEVVISGSANVGDSVSAIDGIAVSNNSDYSGMYTGGWTVTRIGSVTIAYMSQNASLKCDTAFGGMYRSTSINVSLPPVFDGTPTVQASAYPYAFANIVSMANGTLGFRAVRPAKDTSSVSYTFSLLLIGRSA